MIKDHREVEERIWLSQGRLHIVNPIREWTAFFEYGKTNRVQNCHRMGAHKNSTIFISTIQGNSPMSSEMIPTGLQNLTQSLQWYDQR